MQNKVSKINKRQKRLSGWHKYAVIAIFLIVTIGFVSGLLVANNSMITSAEKLKKESCLEDGCFEFDKKLSESSIETLEAGEKADVKQYYLDKAHKEADKEVKKAVDEAIVAFDPTYQYSTNRLETLRASLGGDINDYQRNYVTNAIHEIEAQLPPE